MLRASAAIEKLGMPTVSLVGSGFVKQAEFFSKGLGVPLALAAYPGTPMVDSHTELARKVVDALAPAVIRGLTGNAPEALPSDGEEPAPGDIIFRGTLEQVQAHFYKQMWTDGLPIIPPTRSAVDAFLRCTDRHKDDVIAVVPQEGRQASILSIAINGVMAGCRPEYMPLLIAVVEAICDPEFRLEDAGATPGWEPLVVVGGPIIKVLDFNYGQGVMRVGRQANTSVGRFLRLYLRNICGYRIPPGAGDKGSIGYTFNVALAEDEDAAREIGWPTFAMDRGFRADENVVTVQSVVAITPPTYSAGAHAVDHVGQWADVMGKTFTYWSHVGLKRGRWHPLIVAGPGVAKVISREWNKGDVRHYLRENIKVTAERAAHYAAMTSTPTFDVTQLAKEGILPSEYAQSEDPNRLIHVIVNADMIGLLVAGDVGRNQSRGYMGNHVQGAPVSKRIQLPSHWKDLLYEMQKSGD